MEFNKIVRLKDIAEVEMGQSPKSEFYNEQEGTPFLQGTRTFGLLYPIIDTYTTKVTKWAIEGDILFSVRAPVGDINIATIPLCIGRGLAAVRSKTNNQKFLFYLLKAFNNYEGHSTGTIFSSINKSTLENLEFAIPEENIQSSIGDFLWSIDEKIELNNNIISNLEKLSQTLFKHWFIDFEFPNEEGKPYKSSGGEMVESELGEIPKAWEIYNVNEFAKSISNSINKKEKQYAKFLNTSDVLDGEIADVDFLPTKNMPGQAKKLIEQNDILYSEIRPKNKRYAYIQIENADDYVVSTKLMVLRTNEEILSSKLFYIWLTMQSTINELNQIAESRSGTFPQITFSILSKFKLALPPKNLMDALTATVTPLLNEIYELRSENKKLVELRDTLLPKLLSGEIEIPDNLEV
ncbi:restriction endonuclease subunit S [Kurthia sp. Dielmo]|uniref:restriction endonuclease subunit S n=1 Tax=Kurthia sp. Dielmo TaxID=1033738 RepID=UPI001122BFEB|nr:restriction endonuclease subunit S [Kurthia sp. Dielmo]